MEALRTHVQIEDIDVASYRRDPHVMKGRLFSLVERAGNRATPASKTAAWSSHMQKALSHDGLLGSDCPILFIQSLHAFDLPPGLRYAIYTDRVALEGAAVGGVHRSRFTQAWLRREKHFLGEAAIVCVMGPSTKVALTQLYGLDPARISVVGAGPNSPIGSPSESTRLRKLLFVGTQWDLKGGPELLNAFEAARQVVDDLELLIVGGVPQEQPPDGAKIAGRLSDQEMSLAYTESDALVIPTHMDAFGIAIVEALLHGLPCIGTTVGNQRWLIGDAGVVVPPGDTNALTEALIMIADDYPRFRSAAIQRSKLLNEVMQWRLVADKILGGLLYEEAPADLTLE